MPQVFTEHLLFLKHFQVQQSYKYIPPFEKVWGISSNSIRYNREMMEKKHSLKLYSTGLWMSLWLEEFGLGECWGAVENV